MSDPTVALARVRELAHAEAFRVHSEATNHGWRASNGHTYGNWRECPHPDCQLVNQPLDALVGAAVPPQPPDDVVCEHGTAMDVHCCGCHSGFLFDVSNCSCLEDQMPMTIDARPSPTLEDAAEMLWVVLANVSGGDWTKQTPDWQEAAARWRDYYFAAVNLAIRPPVDPGVVRPVPAQE